MAKKDVTVDSYIAARTPPVVAVLEMLRGLVKGALPDAVEGMKWGAPVYVNANGVPVVYLYGGKDHANLGFVYGAGLDDPDGLLEGKGKDGRHVKLFPEAEVPTAALVALVAQCAGIEG